MAYFSFTSQASSFLPREEFMSQSSFSNSSGSSHQESPPPLHQRPNLQEQLQEQAKPLEQPNQLQQPEQPQQSPQIQQPKTMQPPQLTTPLHPRSFLTSPASASSTPSNDGDLTMAMASEYRELIGRRPIEGIRCIEELINWKSNKNEDIIECIFGVVKTVRDSKQTKYKYVIIIDPTSEEDGIELQTFWTQNKIAVGQMMKICKLRVQKSGSSFEYLFTPATETFFFPLFSYDYNDPMGCERNRVLTETHFQTPQDREVCYLLEKWYSSTILNGVQLSKLPEKNSFTNLCCQVLAYNKTPLCINAVVWDVTCPKYSPLLGPDGKWPPGFELINHDWYPLAYGRYFTLSVWREESRDHAQHYDTFKCLDLTNGNDLVVLFNLQIVEDPSHPGLFSLVMRSSRKWGKAVRLCHPKSVIGQMFAKRLQDYRKSFRKKLGLPILDKPNFAEPTSPPPPIESTRIEESNSEISSRRNHEIDVSRVEIPHSQHGPQAQTSKELQPQPEANLHALDPRRKAPLSHVTEQPSVSGCQIEQARAESAPFFQVPIQDPVQMEVDGLPTNDQDETSLLSHLKEKGKPFMVWEALLEMGVENLERYSLLVRRTDEILLSMDGNPLTKEERLRFIRYAIDHLSTEIPALLSNGQHETTDSDDSLLTNDTFPLIDRVKD